MQNQGNTLSTKLGITLTGADERTDIAALLQLLADHPTLEIGLLYSATPEGRPRYPSLDWIHTAARQLAGRCAIHVCGLLARAQLQAGELHALVRHARRVQVNGDVSREQLPLLAAQVHQLITQYSPRVTDLSLTGTAGNHQLLVDASGGRGVGPSQWRRPATTKAVGFAGGLGPDNLASELERILPIARGDSWIDMEQALRTDDWFDLSRCRRVLAVWETTLADRMHPTETTRSAIEPASV
ncbi:hypothetical protein IMW82_13425 [Rhodanobacter sp. B2A1Ga4]|uniref:hypothetical protein n=1 Tax=Rhodanobacter sp. B2A1Ga4 TaxID=2778647 RepID=UPI001B365DDC|nr:hypothetical protein [Rhodanobacter sp. B2A1Ga4]MBQ4855673.1 hypothetical protein [Rhodanobacter sp. B2A1Ga4]